LASISLKQLGGCAPECREASPEGVGEQNRQEAERQLAQLVEQAERVLHVVLVERQHSRVHEHQPVDALGKVGR
jgi:hypothetical protein